DSKNTHVLLFAVPPERTSDLDTGTPRKAGTVPNAACGGFLVEGAEKFTLDSLQGDLTTFVRHWMIAHGALLLTRRVGRGKLLSGSMHVQPMERVTTLVTGLGNEMNAPLTLLESASNFIVKAAADVGAVAESGHAVISESAGTLIKNVKVAREMM